MSTERLRKNVGLLSEQEIVQYMQELEASFVGAKTVNNQAYKTAKTQLHILSLHSCNRYNLTLVQLEEKHKEPAKIELKSGYGSNYLPGAGNYKNYTMLVAIANYSENPICNDRARFMINEDNSLQDKARVLKGEGSFMRALMLDTFAEAFKKADGSNRKALIQGLTNNEIEL
jgi:hypothetical protein